MQLLEQWKALQLSFLRFDNKMAGVEGDGGLGLREAPPIDGRCQAHFKGSFHRQRQRATTYRAG